jgi:hypothetical protein
MTWRKAVGRSNRMTDSAKLEAEDLQRLDNVLAPVNTLPLTRRSLVLRVAGVAAAGGTLGATGPIPTALASGTGDSISDLK